MVQFFDPTQEAEIKRRRRIAEALSKQGGPKQTEVIGGWAVPQSGLEQLARGLSGGLGAYQAQTADTKEAELNKQRQELYAKALGSGSGKEAGALLAQDPTMLKEAADLAFPRQTFGSTPAALQLANEVKRLEDAGDTVGAARIREFAKTQEKGMTVGPDGVLTDAPGYIPTKTNIVKSTEKAKAVGKKTGESEAEFTTEYPATSAKSNYAVDLIDQMVGNEGKGIPEHPGLRGAVGFSSIIPNRPGGKAKDFENRLAQIGGQQFLQAFETLKGGGQITETEGTKATNAIARMQTSNSEEEFTTAAKEFQQVVLDLQARANARAAGLGIPQAPSGSPASASANDPLASARAAIARGAPRDAVIKRLQENGINPAGL